MSRVLPVVALGALLSLLAIGLVLAVRPGPGPAAAERAEALARELRCPDCQGLSVADAPTSSAREIRRQIDELLSAGASDADVREHFVGRYGPWILLAPASPLWWLLPIAVVLLCVAGLLVVLARRRGPLAVSTGAPSADERRRVHEEAEALDA